MRPDAASSFARVAIAYRNGIPESWHFGAAAVVAPGGRLVASLGDPGAATFVRSAAKPFQCLPLLLAGGEDRFSLSSADLALICASHGGTPQHTARALDLLRRGGFEPGDLLCGAHPPLDRESARQLRLDGMAPSALHNNCSGKHAGMLLACKLLGLPTASYTAFDHALQCDIAQHLRQVCGLGREQLGLGVDGCGVPSFHMSLERAALGYAVLSRPEAAGLPQDVAGSLRRVVAAMVGEPAMVAGPGRFTTRLMEVTGGRLLGKEGAEGFYAVAVRAPAALGLALKIADGGERCRDGFVLEVLRQLGSLSEEELGALSEFYASPLYNWRGFRVGEVVPEVELERS